MTNSTGNSTWVMALAGGCWAWLSTYQALLRVGDMQAISPPMLLAMQGRDPSSNYLLGSITVP
jgi:hypothetical protein